MWGLVLTECVFFIEVISPWRIQNPYCWLGMVHFNLHLTSHVQPSDCAGHLVQDLLSKSPPPAGITVCSLALGACRSRARRILSLQSPPQPLKLLTSLLRPHADHPAGQPPCRHSGRQHVVPPHVTHNPPDRRAQQRPRPLEQRELHGKEVTVGFVAQGEARRVAARAGGGGRQGHAILVNVRDHGVVLCQDGKDDRGRACREIIKHATGERAEQEDDGGGGEDAR